MKNKNIFILSGPAGAGKNTVWDSIKEDAFSYVEESISFTTRPPRVGESDGKHYHFVSEEKFREMIQKDEFLEYAYVHVDYYGSAKSELDRIIKAGKVPIYIIDVQGTSIIKPILEKEGYRVTTIFLLPPSIDEMKRRINKRGSETAETLQVRINSAINEYEQQDLYDIKIINDDLEKAKGELLVVFQNT